MVYLFVLLFLERNIAVNYVFRKYPELHKVAFPDGMMTYWKIPGHFWQTALGCLSSLSRESPRGTQRKPKVRVRVLGTKYCY